MTATTRQATARFKPLAEVQVGDEVIRAVSAGARDRYWVERVTMAGPKRIGTHCKAYDRAGKLVSRGSSGCLVDPTPEVLAALEAQQQRERDQRAESERHVSDRNARYAAWLASNADAIRSAPDVDAAAQLLRDAIQSESTGNWDTHAH